MSRTISNDPKDVRAIEVFFFFFPDLRFKSILELSVISECPAALHKRKVRPICGQDRHCSVSENRTSSSACAFSMSWCVDSNQALVVAAQPVPDHSSGRIQLFGCSEPSCGWCRPRLGATNCSVWSGYALSAASQHGDKLGWLFCWKVAVSWRMV